MNIYLASPYTSDHEIIMEGRYYAALDATAELIKAGYNVFSPIVHSHHIGRVLGNGNDSAYWTALDLSFIERWADVLVVLCIPGWWKSDGIMREVDRAEAMVVPVVYPRPENCPHKTITSAIYGSKRNSYVSAKARYGYMWE